MEPSQSRRVELISADLEKRLKEVRARLAELGENEPEVFSQDQQQNPRLDPEELLRQLMTRERVKPLKSLNRKVLIQQLNTLAQYETKDLRYLDALNYWYERLPKDWTGWLRNYARALERFL